MKRLITVLSLVALFVSPASALLNLDLTFDSATEWADNSFGQATYNSFNMDTQVPGTGTYDANYAADQQARAYGTPHPTNNPGGHDHLGDITAGASIHGWVEITHSTFGATWRDLQPFGITAAGMDANFSMAIEENSVHVSYSQGYFTQDYAVVNNDGKKHYYAFSLSPFVPAVDLAHLVVYFDGVKLNAGDWLDATYEGLSEQELITGDMTNNNGGGLSGAHAESWDRWVLGEGALPAEGLLPEPATLGMLLIGGCAFLLRRRK